MLHVQLERVLNAREVLVQYVQTCLQTQAEECEAEEAGARGRKVGAAARLGEVRAAARTGRRLGEAGGAPPTHQGHQPQGSNRAVLRSAHERLQSVLIVHGARAAPIPAAAKRVHNALCGVEALHEATAAVLVCKVAVESLGAKLACLRD
eukprot:2589799-Prymnesium_polylepis.3